MSENNIDRFKKVKRKVLSFDEWNAKEVSNIKPIINDVVDNITTDVIEDSNISVFNFNNSNIRTIMHDDSSIWFVASDIAKQLDYAKTQNLTDILDDDEKGTALIVYPSSNQHGYIGSQKQETSIISESGLYHAIFKSRKIEAKAFRKWVTSEVLPSIRKTGSYNVQSDTPAILLEINQIALKLEQKETIIIEQTPKVEFYDTVTQSEDYLNMSTVAKTLNFDHLGRNKLYKFLRIIGFLNHKNEPAQSYVNKGWVKLVETTGRDIYNNVRINTQPAFSQKGIDGIRRLLIKHKDEVEWN